MEGPLCRQMQDATTAFTMADAGDRELQVDMELPDNVLGPYSDTGNEAKPRVLRSVPGRVLGPGHNSIILGPDGSD